MTIDPRVRAQLFALDLIDADADDATAERALRTFCAGAGVAVPETPDGQLRVLRGGQSTTTAGTTASPNVQAAHDQEFEQARRAGIEAYQNRRTELTELQAMINSGHSQPIISDQLLVTELDAVGADGAFKSIATIRGEWRELMAGHRANQPLTLPPVSQTESAEERFCEHAQLAIMDRLGMLRDDQRPANGFAELATMRLNDIGAMCFRFQNRRLESDHNDREGVALELLTSSQFRPRPFGSRWSPGGVMGAPSAAVSDPSVNRPADYPHLLSGLAARMLDRQIGLARVTYPDWCARKPDLPDFKPTTLSQMGTFHRLDEIQDDDRPKQLKLSEELRGYLQIMRKGNKVGLTVVMQANDDLGGFIQQINTLANAHEITIDIGCLDLLAGNVSLWSDGVALFDATHKNLVTGGGVPSTTQAKKMELIHAKQTGVGTTEFIESTPEIVLVPTDLREQALQTYAPFGQIPEIKQPTTDATINVYRGDVAKIVASARLSSYSTAEWYTFDNPEIYTVIAYAFQSGFRGGRRLTWTDIETGTQWFSLEQRAGWAAMGFRGCAKNPGV